MSTRPGVYSVAAKYYDQAFAVREDLLDLRFYVDLARQSGGPVLELACGTGRILLPIARQGIAIHGIDISAPMIKILRKNLQREPAEVKKLISVGEGDIRSFRSSRKYPLVIIPFRPLQNMHSLADQLAALHTAAVHMEEDGILAFDVLFPRFDFFHWRTGEESCELEWAVKSKPGRIVRRYFRKDSVDKVNHSFTAALVFRTYEGGKVIREEAEPIKVSYYTYPHLRALFLLAGLEIMEEYGSLARAPLDSHSQQMVFLLKRRPEAASSGRSAPAKCS